MNFIGNRDQLIKDLRESFDKWKNETNFKPSFEELDEVFYIQDYILASGFVSPQINRMICGRMRDTFYGWVQQIHSWLIPAPYSLVSRSEHQLFTDEEKKELKIILRDFMSLVSLNLEAGLTRDKQKEAEYVDTSLKLWRKHLPSLITFSKKVREYWQESDKKDKDI